MNRLVTTGVGIGLAAGALALALAVPALLDRTAGGADGQAAHAAHGTDDAEWGNGLAGIEVLDQAASADGSRDAAAAEPGSAEEDVTFATEAGLEVSGPASLRGSDEVAALERALAGLEAGGHDAGLVLLDLRTGRRAEYGADVQRYPASCAKALFCCALVQRDGWSEEAAPTIESFWSTRQTRRTRRSSPPPAGARCSRRGWARRARPRPPRTPARTGTR